MTDRQLILLPLKRVSQPIFGQLAAQASQVDAQLLALEWEQNQLTIGQTAMLEESLDEQEARAKYPHNFDTLAMSEDWVAICKSCGLIGAVDDSAREVNGLVFRVTCRSDSYRVQ